MKFRLLCSLAALAALAVPFGGCQKASTDEILVGEFASLTGKEATFGISSHEGTVLAIEELNNGGGVLGKKLKLITEDNQSKPGESANAVNKLIAQDGVVAILGEVASVRSLEAAPICQQNKVPMISPSSTNPKVTETGDYIFRVCFIDPFQGTVMANFAHEDPQGAEGRRLHRREERLLEGPRQVLQGRLHARLAGRSSRNWITTAATRISRASSPRSKPPIPKAFSCPAITPMRR